MEMHVTMMGRMNMSRLIATTIFYDQSRIKINFINARTTMEPFGVLHLGPNCFMSTQFGWNKKVGASIDSPFVGLRRPLTSHRHGGGGPWVREL